VWQHFFPLKLILAGEEFKVGLLGFDLLAAPPLRCVLIQIISEASQGVSVWFEGVLH